MIRQLIESCCRCCCCCVYIRVNVAKFGMSALMYAAGSGYVDVVEALVSVGANVHIVDQVRLQSQLPVDAADALWCIS